MLLCPRCQRANPSEAVFCHFDGAELRPVNGRAASAGRTRLPHEFVFPSGRQCHTFEELAQACQAEWETARDLLRNDIFRKYLANVGRTDLAKAALDANALTDADIALDTFIHRLPIKIEEGPRLDLSPRRINLGTLSVGDQREVRLTILNQGKGLLHGTLAVAEGGDWLKLTGFRRSDEGAIKTAGEQPVNLRIDTRGLVAPNKYTARLTVITNGGIVEVPVRMEVAVRPFALAPFQGVASPRQMAERMRSQPKPAVGLLEAGDVAKWFEANGWMYPVKAVPARGVAAVQQFFEGMGLSKAPPVELTQTEFQFDAADGASAAGQCTLRTDAKKWVYAHLESDAPWLRAEPADVSGPQQAMIAFTADLRNLAPQQVHDATLRVTANADQVRTIRIRVTGRRAPVAKPTRPLRPVIVGATAGLLFRLLLAVPADLYARHWARSSRATAVPESFAGWLEASPGDPVFLSHFVLATWWLGAALGAWWLWRKGSQRADTLFGLVTGGVAGLIASATLACLLPAVEWLPRLLCQRLAAGLGNGAAIGGPWLWTVVWLLIACGSWTVLGGLGGLILARAGPGGRELLAVVARTMGACFHLLGFERLAAGFAGAAVPVNERR